MITNPLVSIAIPAYKANYLKEAIDSALAQTYKNTEIIVVNDVSPETDNIVSIVDSFSDNRIRYYDNEVNLGGGDPANNWDKCLSFAKGEYFCLLCDDDIYKPTFIEELLTLTNQFPNSNVFRARCSIIDESGALHDFYPSSPLWETAEDYLMHVLNGFRRQSISEFMLRTQHVRTVGGYAHLPLAWQADYVSIIKFSQSGGIASTNKPLVNFRMSGQNISSMSSENGIRKIEANMIAYKLFHDFISQKSDNTLLPYMNKSLNDWKYRADSSVIKYLTIRTKVNLLKDMHKYSIDIKAYLKGVMLSIIG